MMPKVSLTAAPDYAAELVAIERRRKLAELMQQQGMKESGPTEVVGGWAIPRSPMEGLGKMAQQWSGAYQQDQADTRMKELAAQLRGDRMADYGTLAGAMQGSPARDIQAQTFEGMTGGLDQQDIPTKPETLPAVPGGQINPAIIAQLRTPEGQAAAMAMLQKQNEPYTLAPDSTRMVGNQAVAHGTPRTVAKPVGAELLQLQQALSALPEGHPNRAGLEQRIKYLGGERAETDKGTWGDPYQMGGAWVQKNDTTGQIRQAVNREPQIRVDNPAPVSAVTIQDPKDPNKTIIVDGRTGRVIGAGPKATDVGKLENKRQFNMQGIGATIAEAESLLTNKAKPPTGSGIGAAYDVAAGVFGKSPAGAVEAQKLKAIGGALTSKMPRMEGPQSDKDVALYKEMAGMVGDPTVPIDRRVAALDEVKKLWAKYERLNPDAFADRRASGNVVDFNSLPQR